MSEQRYIVLTPHQDNVNEPISAEHINELQDAIVQLQSELQRQSDEDFLNSTLFVLENSTVNNAAIVDDLQTAERFDVANAQNIIHLSEIGAIVLTEGNGAVGIVESKPILNLTERPFRRLRLVTNEFLPVGASIKYEVSFNNMEYFEITPGDAEPLDVGGEEQLQMTLRITMTATGGELWELPRVDGLAFLYQDDKYAFRFMDDGLDIDIEASWDGTIIP